MTDRLVSVIVPTYNRAYCIAAAIDSVLTQTHDPVEVVVVDDGSTDDTADVVARRFGRDPRVRFFAQANAGCASARNTGLRLAAGSFVALLDSDDVWLPWKLEAQLACLRHFAADSVCSDMSAVGESGAITNPAALRALYHAWNRFGLDELFDRSALLSDVAPGPAPAGARTYVGDVFTAAVAGNLVCNSSLVMTRALLDRVGFYDESLAIGEDYDFNLRVCREGRLCFIDASSLLYRHGTSDQLTKHTLTLALNYIRVLEPALARDRDRIRMTDGQIRRMRADAFAWAGNELLAAERSAESAAHFRRAVRLGRRDASTLLRLMLASTPTPLRRVALRAYHTLKPPRARDP